ncbi:early nodulin-like protein 4 [Actinidia eriantha]|uniref:early nodulin-like protein 4 n=1 Tax=Actinidia eriantha TaxID=165200 RepID=UPI00258FAE65|nr:early nodulin-like protein 4 [Actinidia eriantha]
MCFVCSSQAHFNFYVGGRDGWVLKPSETYNHWAERNRFQVNDSLIFKYKKDSDSVLVVNKDDYYKCSKKPIQALEDGDSVFKFDRSGPFFFISGHGDNCEKGQKFIIIVLAVRNNTHKSPSPSPPPYLSPSPAPKTPTSSPSPYPASVSPNAESPNESPMSMAPEHHPVDAHAPVPAPAASTALGGSGVYLLGLSCVILGCFFGLL